MGDGACSVLRPSCHWHEGDLAVIDCGSDSVKANVAAKRLLAEIDYRPQDITTIVVTHFDTDHYRGLLHLASWMQKNQRKFRQLNLIAPRPPDVEPDFTSAYLALAGVKTGVRNLDVAEALWKVTESGRFTYTPVFRGDPGFWAANSHYSVHWPPHNLPTGVVGDVRKAMSLYGDLAKKLKERGIPDLEDNMRVAREGRWLKPPDRQEASGEIDEENIALEPFGEDVFDEEGDENIDFADLKDIVIPNDLRGEFNKAWNAFRRANNNMSIVFDDDWRKRLVVFGDAGAPVLKWIALNMELTSRYKVMLAPHHGTHFLPREFATQAGVCISQNGTKRGRFWTRHRASHANFHSCRSTMSGNHHVYVEDGCCSLCEYIRFRQLCE